MRLVIAVLDRRAAVTVTDRLRAAGFGVTRLASTGGFLQRGNVTLFTGVEDDQVDAALGVVREALQGREGGEPTGVAFVTRVNDFRRV